MFKVGHSYKREDIYKILNVPLNKQKGEWHKGYRIYEGNVFIFSNVGIPGRTGHDYRNYWDGDLFFWEATKKSNIQQPQIRKMLNPLLNQKIFLFTRTQDRLPFTFEGNVVVKEILNTSPVRIVWKFEVYPYEALEEKETTILKAREPLIEGAVTRITVNKYERSPLARRMCIEHYGAYCNVCNFDFYVTYGELGKGYIHVHHIVPISALGNSYVLVPEKDLIPVCPNCHSMIHKKSPPIQPEVLRRLIRRGR